MLAAPQANSIAAVRSLAGAGRGILRLNRGPTPAASAYHHEKITVV
jgi:hypothetical protein